MDIALDTLICHLRTELVNDMVRINYTKHSYWILYFKLPVFFLDSIVDQNSLPLNYIPDIGDIVLDGHTEVILVSSHRCCM